MANIFFSLPGNELLTASLASKTHAEIGNAVIRHFPDGETFVKIDSDVRDKKIVLVCTLAMPDAKILPLYFLAKTARELGAKHICLITPYLAYMRQDARFQPGEGITSAYFADLVSSFADEIVTVDPHLHRRKSLEEIYRIPTTVVHAAPAIAQWIRKNVTNPILIGPDGESEQWVSEVASAADASYTILEKTRLGDKDVSISVPKLERTPDKTPVLIDDIIATARTMIETVKHLQQAGAKRPVCIGVHGIFAGNAYEDLLAAGAEAIVTCNTIPHPSNSIGIENLIAPYL